MTGATGDQPAGGRGRRKVRLGVVVSDKMQQTVVVQFTRQFAYPVYGKQVIRTKRVKAHNDKDARTGDTVRLMETRPLSKDKRWRVVDIVTRAR
jgi:small subunit ribosomal protein S17